MDETCSDIMPFYSIQPLLQYPPIVATFQRYDKLILPDLYHNPDGIHGLGHIRRTLLLSLLMAHIDQLSDQRTRILAYASVYHDIGRTHDGADDYHGYASYQKVIAKELLRNVETHDVNVIKELIERHAISDRHAFDLESLKEPTKDEVGFLLRYFKDADGLDRVRLGDLNVKYLRTNAARKMPIVAQKLLAEGKTIFREMVSFEQETNAYPLLSARFQNAMTYALELHRNQIRKGTRIPYAAHIISVAALVLEYGGDEDAAIGGLLHDAAEDQGGQKTLDEIRRLYGDKVAEVVADCTDAWEQPKPPWRERKEKYIEHLYSASTETLLVSCADKLHNARSILGDYRICGEAIWARFCGGKSGSLWYYRALADTYKTLRVNANLASELERTVAQVERLAGKISNEK